MLDSSGHFDVASEKWAPVALKYSTGMVTTPSPFPFPNYFLTFTGVLRNLTEAPLFTATPLSLTPYPPCLVPIPVPVSIPVLMFCSVLVLVRSYQSQSWFQSKSLSLYLSLPNTRPVQL